MTKRQLGIWSLKLSIGVGHETQTPMFVGTRTVTYVSDISTNRELMFCLDGEGACQLQLIETGGNAHQGCQISQASREVSSLDVTWEGSCLGSSKGVATKKKTMGYWLDSAWRPHPFHLLSISLDQVYWDAGLTGPFISVSFPKCTVALLLDYLKSCVWGDTHTACWERREVESHRPWCPCLQRKDCGISLPRALLLFSMLALWVSVTIFLLIKNVVKFP